MFNKRIFSQKLKRTAGAAFGAAAAAYPYAKRAYQGYRILNSMKGNATARGKLTSRRIGNPYSISTSHGQQKTTYNKRKKRRGGGLRAKRMKQFKRKVQKVINGNASMCMYQESYDASPGPYSIEVLPNSTGMHGSTTNTLTAGRQLVLGHSQVYGLAFGGGNTGVTQIIQNWLNNNSWAIDDFGDVEISNAQLQNQTKFRFKKGEIRYTITNQTGDDSVEGDYGVDLILDAYEFVAAQNIDDANNNDPVETWYNLLNGLPFETGGTGYAKPQIYHKGQTPLDCPGFGKFWTLLSKKRIVVPYSKDQAVNPETTITMNLQKPFTTSKILSTDTDLIKGRTKYMMFIISPELTNNVYSGYTGESWPICRIYVTKQWHYKVYPTKDQITGAYQNRPRSDKAQYTSPLPTSTGM